MTDNVQNNKRLMRNTAFLYVRMLLVIFLAFYTTRVVLQVLGVEDYGVYNVIGGFVSMLAVLNSCLTTGTNRFYNVALGKQDTIELSNVYKSSLLIQIIIIAIIILISETIGLWYINNKMVIPEGRLVVANWLFQFSVMTLLLFVLQTPYSAAIMAYERMDYYAIVSIIDAFLKLGIAFALQWLDFDHLLLYGFLMMVISVIRFLLYYFYCKAKFHALRFSRGLDSGIFKKLLVFSGWSTLDPFSYIVRDQGSNMALNLFFGTVVNAAYGVAAQMSGAVSSFSNNLSVAFRPQIIQAYSSQDFVRAKRLMLSMSKINFILQSMIAIPLIFEISLILGFWLGPNYPEYTKIFAILVVTISTINTLNEPVSIIMVASGNIKRIKIISMLIICSIIPIGYFLFTIGMPPYTIYLVMLVLTIINQISCVYIMSRECSIIKPAEYFRKVALPCMLYSMFSLVVPSLIVILLPPSIYRLIALFMAVMVSSGYLAYKVCLDETERPMLLRVINNICVKFKIK